MRRALLEAALEFTGRGLIPSVSDVAEAAQVSRATAYRYFPSQSTLVQAVVAEALGPILRWTSNLQVADPAFGDLIAFAYPRMEQFEAPLRAALRLWLDQWARRRAGTLGDEPLIVRGNRIGLIRHALEPLNAGLPKQSLDRLTQAIALVYGTETLVILKDMFGLSGREVAAVAEWAARALVRAALEDVQERTRAPVARSRPSAQRRTRKKPGSTKPPA